MSELRFTRVFAAPRGLVFECLTTREHLTRFWGPAGTTAPLESIQVDPRAGGVFETVIVGGDGSRFPTRAIYLEVAAPERLVWREEQSGMTVTCTLLELGEGRTEVRIHETDVPVAAMTEQAKTGFLTSLDRFAAYLEEIR